MASPGFSKAAMRTSPDAPRFIADDGSDLESDRVFIVMSLVGGSQ